MEDLNPMLSRAFRELAVDAVHPKAEEIAEALDGRGSEFTRTEVRAHLGWCEVCQGVSEEYAAFQDPATDVDDQAAWVAMKRRLPAPAQSPAVDVSRPTAPARRWLPMAAAVAILAGPALTWKVMNDRPPVIEQRVVEKLVDRPGPVAVADMAVVDLYPVGLQTRSGGDAGAGPPRVDGNPGVFILQGAPGQEITARVLDATGKELWSGRLSRRHGAFTLQLAAETLRQRPLLIDCGTTKYRLP